MIEIKDTRRDLRDDRLSSGKDRLQLIRTISRDQTTSYFDIMGINFFLQLGRIDTIVNIENYRLVDKLKQGL